MRKNKPSPYGYDNRPPFSLYQSDDGKWGLIDADGTKLPAEFNRSDDGEVFWCVPWETLSFSESEGFDLLAWFDPCETWFNFTYDNPDYPDRWGKLLWRKITGSFDDFKETFISLLDKNGRRLIDVMASFFKEEKEIERRCGDDWEKEDKEMFEALARFVATDPSLTDFKAMNQHLAPIIDNPDVSENEKAILWNAKVEFDYNLREYYLKEKDNG